jgi:SARP family transcriptional regulator, regulator of embCAB operon
VPTATEDQLHTTAPRTVTDLILDSREQEVLRAIGRGLSNTEIAAALGISDKTVVGHIRRIYARLGLRDRAAAIVYAFDHGIVTPAPRPNTTPVPGPRLRISVLGPLRAWRGGEPLDIGPVRQRALLAALVLRLGVTVSQRELLDGLWGLEPPAGNVVAVYVYRLRTCLRPDPDRRDSVISRDRWGYRFVGDGVSLDSAQLEEIVAEATAAQRVDDLPAAVGLYSRALGLFHGEPLAGLPGPFAELQGLRLAERRITLAQWKAECQLRLGRHADAVCELSALAPAYPHSEPVAALLMRALHHSGRQADALAVFTRTSRRLMDDLGVQPGEALRRTRQAVLRGDDTGGERVPRSVGRLAG